MWLDLSKIIEMPGGRQSFQVTLDPERLTDPAIVRFKLPPEARGEVVNTAGLLNLRLPVDSGTSIPDSSPPGKSKDKFTHCSSAAGTPCLAKGRAAGVYL